MTNDVKTASPNQSIRDAARLMAQIDAGVLPVGENDQLVGMITDRDIAIRAVGADKGPQTPIRNIMSKEVMYCFEDDDLYDVVQNMADIKPCCPTASSDRLKLLSALSCLGTQPC
jgi:CBS domain-containing protein